MKTFKVLNGSSPIEIRSISRLKFRDKNKNNELRYSSTIKIEFASNLLPKYITNLEC